MNRGSQVDDSPDNKLELYPIGYIDKMRTFSIQLCIKDYLFSLQAHLFSNNILIIFRKSLFAYVSSYHRSNEFHTSSYSQRNKYKISYSNCQLVSNRNTREASSEQYSLKHTHNISEITHMPSGQSTRTCFMHSLEHVTTQLCNMYERECIVYLLDLKRQSFVF